MKINWKDKQSWAESLFYALCILMVVLFAIQGQFAAFVWVIIAAQNFHRANAAHRRHIADLKKWLADIKALNDMLERSKK